MKKVIVLFILVFAASMSLWVYSGDIQSDLQNNLVRLHIIANSDSEYDQCIKLIVRDAVLEDMRSREYADKADIAGDAAAAEEAAVRALAGSGAGYGARAYYGSFYFPEKKYKNLTLPAGEYVGVEIVLGNGAGHNWWCVLYPPMCITDGNTAVMSYEAEAELRKNLRPETYEIVTRKNGKTIIKFKVVEALQKLKSLKKR